MQMSQYMSEEVPELLEGEMKRHEREELAGAITEMKALLSRIPDNEIARSIRESRDQR